jgi:hypothetical protein
MVHKSQPFGEDRALSFGGFVHFAETRTSFDQVMPVVQLHCGNLIRVHVKRA